VLTAGVFSNVQHVGKVMMKGRVKEVGAEKKGLVSLLAICSTKVCRTMAGSLSLCCR
jgi:uncharacterized protein (UPF0261 family)